MGRVAIATPSRDRWPEQTRGDSHHRGAPSVSTAARRANEVLREMGRLKTEMKMLLTQPENSLETTRPPPDHHKAKDLLQSQQNQSQQNQSQQNQSGQIQSQQNQSQQNQFHQNQSQQIQSQQNQSQQNQSQQFQSQQIQSQQNQSLLQRPQFHRSQSETNHFQSQQNQSQQNQSQQFQSQQIQSQQNQSQLQRPQHHQNQSQPNHFQSQQSQSQQIQSHQNPAKFHSKSVLVQRRPVVPSMLEEAGQVLRQVRRQKKVLEENLEALLRAKTGEEEVSVVGEEAVELDGGLSPPPVLYQGPVFPPQARSALPAQGQTSTLDTDHQRDALENRLVEWVEQQLMSRMISEMYRPPPSDPAQNVSTDQSELEERSVTSDI
ncbi:transcription factor SPT20 homolog, partial [Seriola lalandi dorsalis]|uniref:transcription factor SPT20 homolog n=1 Tax=Seriola lalandi dorsalis TaxID=1841481 RepID=UPI000C6F6714